MGPRFTGKVAVVTGGASGIGRAVTARLAAEGARVLVADRSADAGLAAAEAIAAAGGGEARFVETDVTAAADCARMVDAAVSAWGRLDVLVCSAGIGGGAPLATLEEAAWDRILAVNLKGTFLSVQAALPHLGQVQGSVVTIASLAALKAGPGFGPYAASKAGVVQLTRVLAVEGAAQKVRANCLCPVWIDTPLLQGYLESLPHAGIARREMVRAIPLGRIGTPEDVAGAALFLASDEASFITGIVLPIDGGALCV